MTGLRSGSTAALPRNIKPQSGFPAATGMLVRAAVVAATAAGCSTTTTAGVPAPAPSSDHTIEHVFPTAAALGAELHTPLVSASTPRFGGTDVLRAPNTAPAPAECGGVIAAGERATFHDAPVRGAAVGTFVTNPASRTADPVNLVVSIVELDSPRSAQTFYATTRTRWQHCLNVTVTQPNGSAPSLNRIDPVTESTGILYAGVTVSDAGEESMDPILERRVFTTKTRYLIDVDLAGAPPADAGKAADTARALAQAIADHIT